MHITTLAILAVSLSLSVIIHTITFFLNRRPKFVVVGAMSYKEFNSWHEAKKHINNELSVYQVFIYEKNEYTYITSSNYMRRQAEEDDEIDVE